MLWSRQTYVDVAKFSITDFCKTCYGGMCSGSWRKLVFTTRVGERWWKANTKNASRRLRRLWTNSQFQCEGARIHHFNRRCGPCICKSALCMEFSHPSSLGSPDPKISQDIPRRSQFLHQVSISGCYQLWPFSEQLRVKQCAQLGCFRNRGQWKFFGIVQLEWS